MFYAQEQKGALTFTIKIQIPLYNELWKKQLLSLILLTEFFFLISQANDINNQTSISMELT